MLSLEEYIKIAIKTDKKDVLPIILTDYLERQKMYNKIHPNQMDGYIMSYLDKKYRK